MCIKICVKMTKSWLYNRESIHSILIGICATVWLFFHAEKATERCDCKKIHVSWHLDITKFNWKGGTKEKMLVKRSTWSTPSDVDGDIHIRTGSWNLSVQLFHFDLSNDIEFTIYSKLYHMYSFSSFEINIRGNVNLFNSQAPTVCFKYYSNTTQ